MQDRDLDNAIASNKTYGNLDVQHAVFRRLREEDPVHWTEPDGYKPFWTISKHADVMEIERQQDRFLNAPRSKLFSIDFQNQILEIMKGKTHLVRGLPQMDGGDHKAYRQLTQAWFQPKQVKQFEARIAALAKRTVDDLLAKGPEFDFYADIAVWYPLRVIMLILGLPASDEVRLLRITQAYFGGSDPEAQKGSDLIKATQDYVAYFDGVSEDRRRNPTEDVASVIANSQIDGRPIGHYEASSYYIALASAGHDTTSGTCRRRPAGVDAEPGAVAQAQGRPVARLVGGGGDGALGVAGEALLPHRDRGLRARQVDQGRRPPDDVLPLGEPRRGDLRRSVRIPRRPQPQPPRRLRLRRPRLPRHVHGQLCRRSCSASCSRGSTRSSSTAAPPGSRPRSWAGSSACRCGCTSRTKRRRRPRPVGQRR